MPWGDKAGLAAASCHPAKPLAEFSALANLSRFLLQIVVDRPMGQWLSSGPRFDSLGDQEGRVPGRLARECQF
jgi:hypothetical protein